MFFILLRILSSNSDSKKINARSVLLPSRLSDCTLKDIKVTFTFLNLVNKKNMKKRLSLRNKLNRYDNFKNVFYDKVQRGFLKIYKKNAKRYMLIDSNLDMNNNKKIVLDRISNLIKK